MSELFNPIAFAAGMVALINPCGFALLPAYLGFFLGAGDGGAATRLQALHRSQVVGASLSLGFVAVFGLLGVVFTGLQRQISPILPWFSMTVGIALALLGLAMLRGFKPSVNLLSVQADKGAGSAFNMFWFGVSYAVASLSCTIGVFLAVVGTSVPGTSTAARLGGFLSYGVGMGLLATVLTLAVGFGKHDLVGRFRRLLPWVNLISGAILVPVGVYVFLFGWWERLLLAGSTPPQWLDTVMLEAGRVQADLATWVDRWATELGIVFVAVNLIIIVLAQLERRVAAPEALTDPSRTSPS